MVINTLHYNLPPELETDSAHDALGKLHVKTQQAGTAGDPRLRPLEYLLIKPLAPDIGPALAGKAAEHVQALDDLGLIVRLDL